MTNDDDGKCTKNAQMHANAHKHSNRQTYSARQTVGHDKQLTDMDEPTGMKVQWSNPTAIQ